MFSHHLYNQLLLFRKFTKSNENEACFRILLFVFLSYPVLAQEQQMVVPYTLADRERTIRLEGRMSTMEAKMSSLENQIRTQGEEINKKIDRLQDKFDRYFMWEFGLVLISIFGLVGFIIYDRKTTLLPVESKTDRIIKVLKDAAEQNPTIKESLKRNTLS